MPQIFKIGPYWVYFWSNESNPLEPVHVHISEGRPMENATKVWITHSGKCMLCNNNSDIPNAKLKMLLRILEANTGEIVAKWQDYFGEITYYC